jgi:hypothetical protein
MAIIESTSQQSSATQASEASDVTSKNAKPHYLKVMDFHPWERHRERQDEYARAVGVAALTTRVRDWTITASELERAIMEVLSLVDDSESSFTQAAELFERLTVLRPAVVNQLLAACRSLKVKRLFLFLRLHYRYPWTFKLDRSRFDLGKGKRQIVRGGRYNSEQPT